MNLSSAFDAVTKAAAAAGAVAAIYTFITKKASDVLPVVLTVPGLGYEALLGLSGLCIIALELRYWKGPVHRRPSYMYRLMLTRPRGRPRIPTDWEIAARARRRDQVYTLLFGLFSETFLGPLAYRGITDDLSKGFPVDSWSITWFSGSLALGAMVFVSGRMLWSWLKGDRVPPRKQRCASCGEFCQKEARVCRHCNEWFPRWKLTSPSRRAQAEDPRLDGSRRQ